MDIPFEKLNNSVVLITGATGLIGSFIVDVLMYRNKNFNSNIKIIANSLNESSLKERFKMYLEDEKFYILPQDVTKPLSYNGKIDFIIHAASNAHPKAFTEDPVGTMNGNIMGIINLLEYAKNNEIKRLLFISSGEIYGMPYSNISSFKEDYCGIIDNLNPRSCYPISKKAAETLAVSYASQYNLDVVIARLCHTYGPNYTVNDSRVYAQFLNNVLNDKDIILKSKGSSFRSYSYITDTISGILYVLLKGNNSEAYNIANPNSNISILEMANIIANAGNKKVLFDLPTDVEKNNFNSMDLAVLDSTKLLNLGWKPIYDAKSGFERTFNILKKIKNN